MTKTKNIFDLHDTSDLPEELFGRIRVKNKLTPLQELFFKVLMEAKDNEAVSIKQIQIANYRKNGIYKNHQKTWSIIQTLIEKGLVIRTDPGRFKVKKSEG